MKKRLLFGLSTLVVCCTAWAGWRGDLNNDNQVDVTDVSIMIDMVLGKTAKDIDKADLSGDGDVDVTDVSKVIDMVLGKAPLEEDITTTTITVKGVSFEMVEVKGGTFTMGATSEQGSDADSDEEPTHRVTISDFSIGQTEVTQALWQAVMGSNPSNNTGDLQRPVEGVSWTDCQEFITKLNALTGKRFRLPTEAEWEYAARGGQYSKGYKYAGSNNVDDVAWYLDNTGSTNPVAQKKANELGLYDMSGNVWEWCMDWYKSNYYSVSPTLNPVCFSEANNRIRRGGAFNFGARSSRVSYRYNQLPNTMTANTGLRLVLSPLEFCVAGDVPFTLVHVEGGTFNMGATPEQGSDAQDDEYPVHQVTLSDFCIAQTEVTQALWLAVMGDNPSFHTGDLQRPVEGMSWERCQTFITKLNELTGKNFRLPTEAEWEYAARGGKKSKGFKYTGSNTIDDVAWYTENSLYVEYEGPDYGTHVVATKLPNELGLFDMSGNVWEQCADWYGPYSDGAQTNPVGPSTGYNRVCRGASWNFSEEYHRVSKRYKYPPQDRSYVFGMRLAMDEK